MEQYLDAAAQMSQNRDMRLNAFAIFAMVLLGFSMWRIINSSKASVPSGVGNIASIVAATACVMSATWLVQHLAAKDTLLMAGQTNSGAAKSPTAPNQCAEELVPIPACPEGSQAFLLGGKHVICQDRTNPPKSSSDTSR